jgi:hypothetical protein
LVSGVALNFVCDSLQDNYNHCNVYYETSEDIDLDEKAYYDNYRYVTVYKKSSSIVIVLKNSKVKFTIYSYSRSYTDSVYVSDLPYTYNIK